MSRETKERRRNADMERARNLRRDGLTYREIADVMGITRKRANALARGYKQNT